jgi:hypothetical protein
MTVTLTRNKQVIRRFFSSPHSHQEHLNSGVISCLHVFGHDHPLVPMEPRFSSPVFSTTTDKRPPNYDRLILVKGPRSGCDNLRRMARLVASGVTVAAKGTAVGLSTNNSSGSCRSGSFVCLCYDFRVERHRDSPLARQHSSGLRTICHQWAVGVDPPSPDSF